MGNIVPFESASLPAHLQSILPISNDLASGSGGFPVLSIKGKVFHLKRGDELTLVSKPETPDEPLPAVEAVILKAYPEGGKTAKIYYSKKWSEGDDASPDCYSNDGVAPASDAVQPQAEKCALCPHNVWGSRITDNGAKSKACQDAKRLAIAWPNAIKDPMLLRVPAASLKALTQYGDLLAKRGVPYQAVQTRIGFDYSVSHPQLTFKPVGFIDEAMLAEVAEMQSSHLVQQITGQVEMPKRDPAPAPQQAAPAAPQMTAPAAPPAAPPPAAPKPAAKPKAAPKQPAPVQAAPAQVEAAPAAPSAPKVVEASEGMDGLLADLDFDD